MNCYVHRGTEPYRYRTHAEDAPEQLIFYAFDLLYLDGDDLRAEPLLERKAALAALLGAPEPSSGLQISDHVIGDGPAVFEQVCRMGLEGIVSKRIDAVYQSGRTATWLKIKHYAEGEFVSCEPR